MYLPFYELDKKPFQISSDPQFLWMGEKHKEALAMLKYGIMDNRGFVMLTGDVGTGKTTIVNALIDSLGPDVVIANITDPGLDLIDFLNHLAAAFGFGGTYTGKGPFLLSFKNFLEACDRDGKQVLLITDEAQRMSQDMLEEVRLLSNLEHQDRKLLNIFFVGQDELREILDCHENRALRQRMTLQYHLEPLSEREIGQFIRHRLKVAGTEKQIFTQFAIREIYEFSGGYPRITNIICDHAMLAGYVAGNKLIDVGVIRECAEDLNLPKLIAPPPDKNQDETPEKKYIKEFILDIKNRYSEYLPYLAAIVIFILLACLIYFPLKNGASFTDIPGYWLDQNSKPSIADSKQMEIFPAPASNGKVMFKVKEAGRLGGGAAPTPGSSTGQQEGWEAGTPGGQDEGDSTTESQDGWRAGTSGGQEAEAITAKSVEKVDVGESEGKQVDNEMGGPEYRDNEKPGAEQSEVLLKGDEVVTSVEYPSLSASQHPSILASQPAVVPSAEKHYNLAFQFDSNDLSPEGYERLDTTVAYMKEDPSIALIVTGHTDGTGEGWYNIMLSKFRADIVKNYLIARGIDPDRITSIGKGSEDPLAENEDDEGRRMNRRVEVEMRAG